MSEAATGFAPPNCSLPDEIVMWEILVRLPPKPLLRCRAVCRAWRHATSTNDFLLAHHAHQPTLPLICGNNKRSIDIVAFDHRSADQLQPVARLDGHVFHLEASCDGLLVLSDNNGRFSICNLATRQYARLKHLDKFMGHYFTLLGMYPHNPTGEYGLIAKLRFGTYLDSSYYVGFTLDSSQLPRDIECPHTWEQVDDVPVLFHGNLHWYAGHIIMVFDTTTESFRQMRVPNIVCSEDVEIFESGDNLGIWRLNEEATNVDIWMMQDYEGEVWTFKHRVEFPIAELTVQSALFRGHCIVVVPSWDGDVFGLARFGEWLHQIDINGKLVTSFHRKGLHLTPIWLKQTLVSHSFFQTLDGYVVNKSPFI